MNYAKVGICSNKWQGDWKLQCALIATASWNTHAFVALSGRLYAGLMLLSAGLMHWSGD